MKVLEATSQTQGQRKSDFHWADEGELVKFPFECDRDRRTGPDGGCGCRRSFSGTTSHKGTTTAKIVERDITTEQFCDAVVQAWIDAGWPINDTEVDDELRAEAREILRIANTFPVGAVIEKRGSQIVMRPVQTQVTR